MIDNRPITNKEIILIVIFMIFFVIINITAGIPKKMISKFNNINKDLYLQIEETQDAIKKETNKNFRFITDVGRKVAQESY